MSEGAGIYATEQEVMRLQKLLTEAFECLREHGIKGVATIPEGIRKLAARATPSAEGAS